MRPEKNRVSRHWFRATKNWGWRVTFCTWRPTEYFFTWDDAMDRANAVAAVDMRERRRIASWVNR